MRSKVAAVKMKWFCVFLVAVLCHGTTYAEHESVVADAGSKSLSGVLKIADDDRQTTEANMLLTTPLENEFASFDANNGAIEDLGNQGTEGPIVGVTNVINISNDVSVMEGTTEISMSSGFIKEITSEVDVNNITVVLNDITTINNQETFTEVPNKLTEEEITEQIVTTNEKNEKIPETKEDPNTFIENLQTSSNFIRITKKTNKPREPKTNEIIAETTTEDKKTTENIFNVTESIKLLPKNNISNENSKVLQESKIQEYLDKNPVEEAKVEEIVPSTTEITILTTIIPSAFTEKTEIVYTTPEIIEEMSSENLQTTLSPFTTEKSEITSNAATENILTEKIQKTAEIIEENLQTTLSLVTTEISEITSKTEEILPDNVTTEKIKITSQPEVISEKIVTLTQPQTTEGITIPTEQLQPVTEEPEITSKTEENITEDNKTEATTEIKQENFTENKQEIELEEIILTTENLIIHEITTTENLAVTTEKPQPITEEPKITSNPEENITEESKIEATTEIKPEIATENNVKNNQKITIEEILPTTERIIIQEITTTENKEILPTTEKVIAVTTEKLEISEIPEKEDKLEPVTEEITMLSTIIPSAITEKTIEIVDKIEEQEIVTEKSEELIPATEKLTTEEITMLTTIIPSVTTEKSKNIIENEESMSTTENIIIYNQEIATVGPQTTVNTEKPKIEEESTTEIIETTAKSSELPETTQKMEENNIYTTVVIKESHQPTEIFTDKPYTTATEKIDIIATVIPKKITTTEIVEEPTTVKAQVTSEITTQSIEKNISEIKETATVSSEKITNINTESEEKATESILVGDNTEDIEGSKTEESITETVTEILLPVATENINQITEVYEHNKESEKNEENNSDKEDTTTEVNFEETVTVIYKPVYDNTNIKEIEEAVTEIDKGITENIQEENRETDEQININTTEKAEIISEKEEATEKIPEEISTTIQNEETLELATEKLEENKVNEETVAVTTEKMHDEISTTIKNEEIIDLTTENLEEINENEQTTILTTEKIETTSKATQISTEETTTYFIQKQKPNEEKLESQSNSESEEKSLTEESTTNFIEQEKSNEKQSESESSSESKESSSEESKEKTKDSSDEESSRAFSSIKEEENFTTENLKENMYIEEVFKKVENEEVVTQKTDEEIKEEVKKEDYTMNMIHPEDFSNMVDGKLEMVHEITEIKNDITTENYEEMTVKPLTTTEEAVYVIYGQSVYENEGSGGDSIIKEEIITTEETIINTEEIIKREKQQEGSGEETVINKTKELINKEHEEGSGDITNEYVNEDMANVNTNSNEPENKNKLKDLNEVFENYLTSEATPKIKHDEYITEINVVEVIDGVKVVRKLKGEYKNRKLLGDDFLSDEPVKKVADNDYESLSSIFNVDAGEMDDSPYQADNDEIEDISEMFTHEKKYEDTIKDNVNLEGIFTKNVLEEEEIKTDATIKDDENKDTTELESFFTEQTIKIDIEDSSEETPVISTENNEETNSKTITVDPNEINEETTIIPTETTKKPTTTTTEKILNFTTEETSVKEINKFKSLQNNHSDINVIKLLLDGKFDKDVKIISQNRSHHISGVFNDKFYNFTLAIETENKTVYVPEYASLIKIECGVNITWKNDKNFNNSVTLQLNNKEYAYLDSINIKIVKKKTIISEKFITSSHDALKKYDQLFVFPSGVTLRFSNIDFLEDLCYLQDKVTLKQSGSFMGQMALNILTVLFTVLIITGVVLYYVLRSKKNKAVITEEPNATSSKIQVGC